VSPWIVLLLVVLVLLVCVGVVVGRRRSARPAAAPTASRDAASVPERKPSRGEGLGPRIRSVFRGGPAEDAWPGLEDLLVKADVGPATAARIVADVRVRYEEGADPVALVADEVVAVLGDADALVLPADRLGVVMVVEIGRAHV